MTKKGCDQDILDEINWLRDDVLSCEAALQGKDATYSERCEWIARIKQDKLKIQEYQKLL